MIEDSCLKIISLRPFSESKANKGMFAFPTCTTQMCYVNIGTLQVQCISQVVNPSNNQVLSSVTYLKYPQFGGQRTCTINFKGYYVQKECKMTGSNILHIQPDIGGVFWVLYLLLSMTASTGSGWSFLIGACAYNSPAAKPRAFSFQNFGPIVIIKSIILLVDVDNSNDGPPYIHSISRSFIIHDFPGCPERVYDIQRQDLLDKRLLVQVRKNKLLKSLNNDNLSSQVCGQIDVKR